MEITYDNSCRYTWVWNIWQQRLKKPYLDNPVLQFCTYLKDAFDDPQGDQKIDGRPDDRRSYESEQSRTADTDAVHASSSVFGAHPAAQQLSADVAVEKAAQYESFGLRIPVEFCFLIDGQHDQWNCI